LKVLHVNDVASVASNLVRGLQSLGIEAELLSLSKLSNRGSHFGLATLPFARIMDVIKLHQIARQQRFDIVHVHYALHAWMPLIAGLPYFLHVHGSDIREGPRIPGIGVLNRMGIRKAIQVFFVTPDLRLHLDQIRPNTILLPDPIDTELFAPSLKNIHGARNVLCISKLDRAKGVERLLESIELMWAAQPDTQIGLFDFGNATRLAQRFFERHSHDPRLILLSRVPHTHMPDVIRSFDVVLGQQSLQVGALGVSELEAMACAKPVVCYFDFPEAYPEPPPILVSRTPREASEQVVELLDGSSLRSQLGQQAREWVVKYHSLGVVAQALVDSYELYL
jgi:glycosyltransferase involved in cell wall biosynthesis